MKSLRFCAFLILFLSLGTTIYSQLYEEELYRSIEEIEPIATGTESASIANGELFNCNCNLNDF